MKPTATIRPDLRQRLPEEITTDLLGLIRRQFVPDLTEKEWFLKHNQFIKIKVVLWPARFMVMKGFTVSPERYQTIMIKVLNEIKQFGATGHVRYWPGYLMKCVQDHWRHHWEEYYAEAKSARSLAENAMLAMKPLQGQSGPDVVEAMAMAHRILTSPRKRKIKVVEKQSSLLL